MKCKSVSLGGYGRPRSLLRFYARTLQVVLVKARGLLAFFVGATMHSVGHCVLALAAAACAQALVIQWGEVGGGSTCRGLLCIQILREKGPMLIAGLGLAAVVVKGVGGTVASYLQARIGAEAAAALRLEVLSGWLGVHRLRQPRQLDHGGDGMVNAGPRARGVAALTTGVREVEVGLSVGLLGGVRAVAQLFPLVLALVWIAPRMAVAGALVFAPFSVLLGRTRRIWKRAHARAAREAEALLEAADEAVRHADLWTTFGAEDRARATVKSLGTRIARRSALLEASTAAMSSANEILGAVALLAALGAARAGWLGDAGDGGTLLSFAVAFFLAYRPMKDLTEARLAWTRASAAFEELSALAPAEAADAASPASVPPSWPLASLHLEDVKLAHGAGYPLTMSVGPGQIVAVLGPTGAGKTTLLRTLLGLEAPLSGHIRYAGASLAGAPPGPVARPFAWVPQESPLLADTLDANVSLGQPGAGPSCARDALAQIGAGHLVREMGTARLGAGGRDVSGGERQWVALARAIATRQPILLLDEPTSGLDGEAQERVLGSIARLRGQRSVVIVTHRPEPLAIADSVIRVA